MARRAYIIFLMIVEFMGLVWAGHALGANADAVRVARRIDNPFLLESVLRQNRSIVDYTLVDRLQKRRV